MHIRGSEPTTRFSSWLSWERPTVFFLSSRTPRSTSSSGIRTSSRRRHRARSGRRHPRPRRDLHRDERHLFHAIDSGCSGYVDQRELGPADWPRLVRLAAKGNRVFSDAAFELFRRSRRRSAAVKNGHDLTLPSTRALSKRERQVLEHLVPAARTSRSRSDSV